MRTHTPPWPIPKLFRLTEKGRLIEALFEGETINTPSMLCVEDYLAALNWAKSIGGLDALMARVDANAKVIRDWVERTPWIEFLAADPAIRSTTAMCLKIVDPANRRARARSRCGVRGGDRRAFLKQQGVAYDISAYRDAPARPAHLVRRHGRCERS